MIRHKLSLKALRTFERAARRMSFKDAAEDMFITPSAVSHQIKALEEHIGVQLFQRDSRALKLTTGGAMYADYLHRMFEDLDGITEKLKNSCRRPAVHLLLPPFFAVDVLLPRLKIFQNEYPDVDICLQSYKYLQDVDLSSMDLIVSTGPIPPRPGFEVTPLLPMSLVPTCSSNYKREQPVECFADLNSHVLIVNESRPDAWDQLARKLNLRTLRPRSLIRLETMAEVNRAIQNGLGVGMIATTWSNLSCYTGTLLPLFGSPEYRLEESYYLFHKPDMDMSDVVNNFKIWMLDSFKYVTDKYVTENISSCVEF